MTDTTPPNQDAVAQFLAARAHVGASRSAETPELEKIVRRNRHPRRIPLPNVIKAAREAGASRVETPDGYVIDLLPHPDANGAVNDFDRPPNPVHAVRRKART